jgi:methyl-accepting chemotaxis protein
MEVDLATEKSDRAHDVEKLMNENGLVREQLNTSNQRIQNLADVIRAQDTLKEIVDVISSNNELGHAILTITQEIARKAGVPID